MPLVRPLTAEEIDNGYEINTGVAIVEHFASNKIGPRPRPQSAFIVPRAPFAWGKTPAKAVEHAIILEEVAGLAMRTESLKVNAELIPQEMLDKHFLRKHGEKAYYGQKS